MIQWEFFSEMFGGIVGKTMIGLGILYVVMKKIAGPLFSESTRRMEKNWEWYRDEVVNPLFEEVQAASRGEFPEANGRYRSKWQDIEEVKRNRVDSHLTSLFSDYVDKIENLNQQIERKDGLVDSFASDLPGGDQSGEPSLHGTAITSNHGPRQEALPESRPQDVKLDEWIIKVWPAFENSDNSEEFRQELSTQYSQIEYDDEILNLWVSEDGHTRWAEDFWEQYENGLLVQYHDSVRTSERFSEEIQDISDNIKNNLQEINKDEFFRKSGKWKRKARSLKQKFLG